MISENLCLDLAVTRSIERDAIYRRHRFPREVIEGSVRWYLTYRLGYRDLVGVMAEWGVHVSYTTIMRWVFRYVPEYEQRWNRRARPMGSSWRVDEMYVRTRPKTGYLYRAVDKKGKTVGSLFQTSCEIAAAIGLFPARQLHRPRHRIASPRSLLGVIVAAPGMLPAAFDCIAFPRRRFALRFVERKRPNYGP